MTERLTVLQGVQIGVESTPGGSVVCNKRLQSMDLSPNIRTNTRQFRPLGNKYVAITSVDQEWSEATITGQATYTEIIYPFASVYSTGSCTFSGSNIRTWVTESSGSSADTTKTFTVEQGYGSDVHKSVYNFIPDFVVEYSRTGGVTINGKMIGQTISTSGSAMDNASAIELVPVTADQVDIYVDTAGSSLGTTKLTRVMSAAYGKTNSQTPLWTLNSSNTSFALPVEAVPQTVFRIKLEVDTVGKAFIDDMRAETTKFFRIKSTGPLIETTTYYLLQLDAAVKWISIADFSDQDGVFATEFTGVWVHDSTWGHSNLQTVVNKIGSL